MEEQLVQLLSATQSSSERPRKSAETQLLSLYGHPEFPLGLIKIASHDSVPLDIRQAALLYLKTFVLAAWSPQFDEFKGQILVRDEEKGQVRTALLELATSDREDRKVKSAASYVVSKIANADFPEQWPDLLPKLLHLIPTGTDGQIHGALKVLDGLVDDCFNEEQFFSVARDLIKVVFDVAVNDARKPALRALSVSVFKGCFDILEMVMEDHKVMVKAFADEALAGWLPFFVEVMKSRLPPPPSEEDENQDNGTAETYRGLVSLKMQVVKVLMRIRSVFASTLSPHTPTLFSATWEELSSLQAAYHEMYIEGERQSRLEDADGLPYTLDFLVLEELDFMQACLRAPPVRSELEKQLQSAQNTEGTWVTEVMKLAVAYAQITTEEEGLWNVDVNIFLSEETSVTANYTPRTACGDLVIKLGEWLNTATVEGLLSYTRTLYSTTESWKAKEAVLFVLNQLLCDFQDVDKQIAPEAANGFIDFIRYAMQQPDDFLRARGYLVAGSLTRTSGDGLHQVSTSFLEASLHAITNDESDVVQVSCIRALQFYLQAIPPAITLPLQNNIIAALSTYLQSQDIQELAECDDLMVTFVETLRDAILLDTSVCLTGGGLDLLFSIASHGAGNFQLVMLVNETFEEVTGTISATGTEAYVKLCEKVLPSLTGAFDIGSLTEENALTNLAAELLAVLAEHGSTPLPQGFVQATMPKLNRLLLGSHDEELLKAATTAVKNIIMHDHTQLFAWHEESGKGGLEAVLVIIDRLLSPTVDDNAASEVGALAAELVEKAGSELLGPYLPQLLTAVAVRLGSASQAQFIQSLTLVFARLSLINAKEVIDFLAQMQVNGENGLQLVLSKWLENSINFAGYDEIRQNVVALSKVYDLQDPRLEQIQVKGNLIVPQSDRIMTRSRARTSKEPPPHRDRMRLRTRPVSQRMVEPEWSDSEDEDDFPPDQYTYIPASLKILKVLVSELLAAAGSSLEAAAAAADLADDASDDGSWEDDPNPLLDLGTGMTKEQLMAFANESVGNGFGPASRQRDDETQSYLVGWFQAAAGRPGFEAEFARLDSDEQEKLRSMSSN
ncbi:ARM repeat-containing protein [Mytilinidion resinicola]|uniref:ARM repeat-containing protein n=1 Tax=Mytilinidion resinicola TaxID=574789 RepID=A0A6A6YKL6_9PEZI|nr:ARM repeat-containing protein [Mytilinidion resinicola]KAF2808514.1 ARM repeat-containing protein [Mytilinidion resinicola]